jgi:hypothetical protein
VSRLVLDAGALIALDRNDRSMWLRLANAQRTNQSLVTHAGIIGQVWRDPRRQARLSVVLKAIDIRPVTTELAKAAGLLLAKTKTADVHDGALAVLADPQDTILTSDVPDLSLLLSTLSKTTVRLVRV